MYPQYMFEQKYENSRKNHLKIVIFTAVKNRCILHGRVFVMSVLFCCFGKTDKLHDI